MKSAAIVAALALAAPIGLPKAALAANANNPYSNVDRRVDAGNNTGDAQVEQLNQAQLGQSGPPAYYGRTQARPTAGGVPPRPAVAPGYAQPYPPVAYAPPAYAVPAYPYGYYPAPAVVVVPRPYFARPFYYPY